MFAVYLGIWKQDVYRHNRAIDCLKARGFSFWDGLEEPIGPNFLYVWREPIPPNGYFPVWFADSFCIKGFYSGFVSGISLKKTDCQLLNRLVNFHSLTILDCELETGSLAQLAKCTDLDSLAISDTKLTVDDVDHLCTMKNLRLLGLVNNDLPEAEKERLIDYLPECEVLIRAK